ncbi:MAG: hypothetical protein HQ579_04265 [Candidatus Omnitrophica bacterium]|nr:hypothetical protein [Candidatus Omnitrophota bacterium]
MKNVIMILSWFLVTAFVGFNILAVLDKKKAIGNLECAGLSFLIGLGAISIEMFLIGAIGLKFRLSFILLPWIALFFFNLVFSRGCFTRKSNFSIKRLSLFEQAIVGLLSFEVCYTFFRALIKPIEAYDSVSIYALKSKILYMAHTIPKDFFTEVLKPFHGVHPDYPLLVSMSEVWFYAFIGSVNDFLVKSIFPVSFLCFLVAFYFILKRFVKKRITALLFTFVLASIAQFNAYATIGVADLLLGVNFSLGLFYLCLWIKDKEKSAYLYISAMFSMLAVWTKNEGMILALIILFVLFLDTVIRRSYCDKGKLVLVSFYFVVVGAFIFGFISYKNSLGLVNENFNLSMINGENLLSGLRKIPLVLYEYQKQFFGFKKWNIVWVISLFLFISRFKESFKRDNLYATVPIILFFIGYTAVYMFSAVEIDFFLRKTTSRFFLHILPVLVFWIACITKQDNVGEALQNA